MIHSVGYNRVGKFAVADSLTLYDFRLAVRAKNQVDCFKKQSNLTHIMKIGLRNVNKVA